MGAFFLPVAGIAAILYFFSFRACYLFWVFSIVMASEFLEYKKPPGRKVARYWHTWKYCIYVVLAFVIAYGLCYFVLDHSSKIPEAGQMYAKRYVNAMMSGEMGATAVMIWFFHEMYKEFLRKNPSVTA